MSKITRIHAFEILDSRGNPTIKTMIWDDADNMGWACVPSGASTGTYEAVELRDGDSRFWGKGVTKAVSSVNDTIALKLKSMDTGKLREIDEMLVTLDGTPHKSKLGANSILSVSLAVARLAAHQAQKELFQFLHDYYFPQARMVLPRPLTNLLNGGVHANNSADLQEFMIVPVATKTFAQSYRVVAEVYQGLKKIIHEMHWSTALGDEGGFAPSLSHNKHALDLLVEAIVDSGYKPGIEVALALDAAANELYFNSVYALSSENKTFTTDEFVEYFEGMAHDYPVVSFEDLFNEDDWKGFSTVTQKIGDKIQIVGDDLYVTNIERLKQGIKSKATNSILVKPNQIGTLTETAQAILKAYEAGLTVIISHRSGETEDPFIADLAVGCGCGQIKAGAPARSERTVKYNRLLEIETLYSLPLAPFPYHGYQS